MPKWELKWRAHNRRLLVNELKNYHNIRQRLIERISDTASLSTFYARDDAEMIRGGHISNPTLKKALDLMTDQEIQELQRRVKGIEAGLDACPAKVRFVIEKSSWSHLNINDICERLHIAQPTYYLYRSTGLKIIAEKLGWPV